MRYRKHSIIDKDAENNEKSFLFSSMLFNQDIIDSSIYERSFMITVKMQRNIFSTKGISDLYQNMDKLNTIIYLRIISALNPAKKNRCHEVASILICADVEGTRINKGNFINPEIPHFHILVILTNEEYKQHKNSILELESKIIRNLAEINKLGDEINRIKNDIRVDKFDMIHDDSDFDRIFTYIYKAHTQANRKDIYFPRPCTYPYQLDIDRETTKGHRFYRKNKEKFKGMIAKKDCIDSELKKNGFIITSLLENESSVNKINKSIYSNGFSNHNPHHQAMPG
jgi:hypothetical protein